MSSYSDFSTSLATHPIHKDLVIKTDSAAIKQALKNLLMTNSYERFYNPDLGGDINALLFEQISPLTAEVLKDIILTSINNFEPRIEVLNLYITPYPDANSYEITLTFSILKTGENGSLEIILERNR